MKPINRTLVTTQVYSALATIALFLSTIPPASAETDTWVGTVDNTWANSGNWSDVNNLAPVNGDSLVFGGTGIGSLSDNLGGALTTYGITFNSSAYNSGGYTITTPNSSSLFLSGQASGNTTGIANSSSGLQTVNLNLNLDWGLYTFSDPAVSLALGGTLTLNSGGVINTAMPKSGGVAFFDSTGTISASSLANDGAGLISGLGGAGLMYNVSTGYPTGLATINGSHDIVPYASYATYASGAIPTGAANNVELTATSAASYTTASGVALNTITASQPGNSGGTSTTTITVTGTLTLGATSGIGGIYALAGSANPNLLTVTGGTITAGPSGVGGTIVVGATDSATASFAPNVASIASAIEDNSGGPVALVKVGYSSMSFSSVNNLFSGGLYILQGQYQSGNSWGSLTGSIYVAPGATCFMNNGATHNDTHNWFLSPGTGFSGDLTSGAQGSPGNILEQGALLMVKPITFTNSGSSGSITLLGPGNTFTANTVPAAGCRMTGDSAGNTTFLEGVITGTGALDLCAVPVSTAYQFNNTTADNTWAGGLIIETPLTSPSSATTIKCTFPATGLGPNPTYTQIPHGAGKGDVMIYSGASSGASTATFNIENNNVTINGLYGFSAGGIPGNVIVENSDNVQMCTLTIGDGNANGYYAGVVLDPNSETAITKIGTGTQVFTGSLSQGGPTTISGGTFELSGAGAFIVRSPITIASGATLDASERSDGTLTLLSRQTLSGSGTVIGTLAVAANSTVSEGTSTIIGTLANTGSTQLQAGGTNVVKVQDATAGAGVGNDLLAVSGNINVTATSANPFTIALTSLNAGAPGNAANFNNTSTYIWTIATGTVTGFTPGAFTVNTTGFSNPLGSGQFFVGNTGTSLVLVFEPVGNDVGSFITPAVNGSGNPTFSGSSGVPGYTYGVESSTAVKGQPWVEAGNVTPSANGSWTFTDGSQVVSPSNPTLFYRLYFPDNPSNPPQ